MLRCNQFQSLHLLVVLILQQPILQVDQIHRSMTFADPRIGLVWAEGLKAKADLVHFDAASLDAFGKRYARAWRELEASLARQESNSGLDTRPAA